jgi:hypothetical protein
MGTRRHRSVALLALAGMLLVGCSGSPSDASAPGDEVTPLIDEALLARDDGDIATFSALLGQAADVCAEPSTARRLDEVSLIAGRWAAALADGRPKVQAVTEDQLAGLDWDALVDACTAARPGRAGS